jgi:hypothetical protein
MEAEGPMQNDERDDRDLPPDEPTPPRPDDETEQPAEEFETPSWPSQDTPQGTEHAPADEPAVPDEPPPADEPALVEEMATESGPPPPEVEAYEATADESAAPAAVPAHSVPATTEPGESTQCPRCGTENRPGIAFCQNCGQRLIAAGAPTTVERPAAPDGTQACPRCGTHNRAGVAFCQNCGASLRADQPGYGEPAPQPAAGQHAVLGPVVLLIGALGIATGWLLPFALGSSSLYDRSFGDPTGYGIAFWTEYSNISGLAAQAYFGFAAPAPLLVVLLVALAVGGLMRARPATLQLIGLAISLLWAIGLVALFVVVEFFGGTSGDLLHMLAGLSPGGIIFALASLIVVIGGLTRFGRG